MSEFSVFNILRRGVQAESGVECVSDAFLVGWLASLVVGVVADDSEERDLSIAQAKQLIAKGREILAAERGQPTC